MIDNVSGGNYVRVPSDNAHQPMYNVSSKFGELELAILFIECSVW